MSTPGIIKLMKARISDEVGHMTDRLSHHIKDITYASLADDRA